MTGFRAVDLNSRITLWSYPLQYSSCASHPTMFPRWWFYCSLPVAQWFPAPPICCPYCKHYFAPFCVKVLSSAWPFSDTSMISHPLTTLTSLLLHGSPSQITTEMADQSSSLACCPTNTGVLLTGLSLVGLFLSPYPSKSSLKFFQLILLSAKRSFFCFVASASGLLSAGLVCKPTHDQKIQSSVRLRAIYWSVVSSTLFPGWPSNCRYREHYLCSWPLNWSSQCPEVSLVPASSLSTWKKINNG